MAVEQLNINESTNVRSATYDPETLELVVFFKSGGVYSYEKVTPSDAAGLAQAISPGSYIHNTFIKPQYKAKKL